MSKLFLLGGGAHEAHAARTLWRFICEAIRHDVRRIAIVIAEQPDLDNARREASYRAAFELFPVERAECQVLFVSKDRPLTADRLVAIEPTGVFVAGGRTPSCHEGVCADRGWIDYLHAQGIPYAGFSSGAVIAADRAILGGRRIALLHCDADVAPADADEGLQLVEVHAGLGLVPFAVEPHATQWGTLTRLIHAVGEGLVSSGWAIDEACMLEIDGDQLRVAGANNAYRVRRVGERSTQVDVFRAGTLLARRDW